MIVIFHPANPVANIHCITKNLKHISIYIYFYYSQQLTHARESENRHRCIQIYIYTLALKTIIITIKCII